MNAQAVDAGALPLMAGHSPTVEQLGLYWAPADCGVEIITFIFLTDGSQ